MTKFKLTYSGDIASETFSGEFVALQENGEPDPFRRHALDRFPTWAALIEESARRFRAWGGAAGDVFSIVRLRTNGSAIVTLLLSPDTIAQMVNNAPLEILSYVDDTPRAASALPNVHEEGFDLSPGVFHAGRAVLAAAFGETVQVNLYKDGSLECPVCGRRTSPEGECRASCGVADLVVDRDPSYGSVDLSSLLARYHAAPRFYFPFPWNPSSGWILRHELVALLEGWRREKAELP